MPKSENRSHTRPPVLGVLALLLVVVLTAGATAACRQQGDTAGTDAVTVELSVQPPDLAVGPAEVTVTLVENGQPVTGADVAVRGDMSHAGMQPVLATAAPVADGVYVADFEWTMAGDWQVTVEATLPDGRTVERVFPAVVEAP